MDCTHRIHILIRTPAKSKGDVTSADPESIAAVTGLFALGKTGAIRL